MGGGGRGGRGGGGDWPGSEPRMQQKIKHFSPVFIFLNKFTFFFVHYFISVILITHHDWWQSKKHELQTEWSKSHGYGLLWW